MAFLSTRLLRSRAWVVTAMVCAAAQGAVARQSRPAPIEDNVKAVFLFNFAKYVSWPPMVFGERSPGDVRVCVTANDGFFALLKTAIQGEDVDGKPLVPVALDGLDDAKNCQILYVGDAQSPDAKAWLTAVRGRQVLTVADGELNDETIISFVRDENRVRFDINRAAARGRGLNISAKLLRLARQVRER